MFKKIFTSILFWFTINVLLIALVVTVHFGCNFTNLIFWWSDFYTIVMSLLIGGIVSFLFYFLVIFIPESRKKKIIKNNLIKFYRDAKENILYQIVFASKRGGRDDLNADSQTIEGLMTVEGFKATFEGGRESHEGYYAASNIIQEGGIEYREIILNLHLLSRQIEYVLHNYSMADQELFDFFKRLEKLLIRLEKIGPGYDEEKQLSGFIWTIFAGFNFIDGFIGYDIVENMIKKI